MTKKTVYICNVYNTEPEVVIYKLGYVLNEPSYMISGSGLREVTIPEGGKLTKEGHGYKCDKPVIFEEKKSLFKLSTWIWLQKHTNSKRLACWGLRYILDKREVCVSLGVIKFLDKQVPEKDKDEAHRGALASALGYRNCSKVVRYMLNKDDEYLRVLGAGKAELLYDAAGVGDILIYKKLVRHFEEKAADGHSLEAIQAKAEEANKALLEKMEEEGCSGFEMAERFGPGSMHFMGLHGGRGGYPCGPWGPPMFMDHFQACGTDLITHALSRGQVKMAKYLIANGVKLTSREKDMSLLEGTFSKVDMPLFKKLINEGMSFFDRSNLLLSDSLIAEKVKYLLDKDLLNARTRKSLFNNCVWANSTKEMLDAAVLLIGTPMSFSVGNNLDIEVTRRAALANCVPLLKIIDKKGINIKENIDKIALNSFRYMNLRTLRYLVSLDEAKVKTMFIECLAGEKRCDNFNCVAHVKRAIYLGVALRGSKNILADAVSRAGHSKDSVNAIKLLVGEGVSLKCGKGLIMLNAIDNNNLELIKFCAKNGVEKKHVKDFDKVTLRKATGRDAWYPGSNEIDSSVKKTLELLVSLGYKLSKEVLKEMETRGVN